METGYQKTRVIPSVVTECLAEYELPDYQGDVRKILSAQAHVIPSGKFIDDNEVRFSGILSIDILYTDSDGKLTAATFSSDYEWAVPVGDQTIDANAQTNLSSLNTRLVGPRKFSAKAVLSSRVIVTGNESFTVTGDCFDSKDAETSKASLKIRSTRFSSTDEREYAEECTRIENVAPGSVEVLGAGGEVQIKEIRRCENGVILSGDLLLGALISESGDVPYRVGKNVSFEELVPITDTPEDARIFPSATLTSVSCVASDDSSGGTALTLSAIAEYGVRTENNVTVEVITDAYLCGGGSEETYSDFSYEEISSGGTADTVVTGNVTLDDGEMLREIIRTFAGWKLTGTRPSLDALTVEGEVQCTVVGSVLSEDGSAGYRTVRTAIPCSIDVPLSPACPADAEYEVRVSPAIAEPSLMGDGIRLDAALHVSVLATQKKCVRILASCNKNSDTGVEKSPGTVSVYYPVPGDSLWSVAKTHRVPIAGLAADNGLTDAVSLTGATATSLSGVTKLIIC